MFTPTDPIISRCRGTPRQLMEAARKAGCPRLDDTRVYADELWRLCELTGIDFGVAAGQWHLETGGGTSWHWTNRLNPGGIGVTDGGDVSIDYRTGENAARGQILHLWAYATTAPVPDELEPYLPLDPRFGLVQRGSATTIQGLQGRWATDPDYARKLCGRANTMFPDAMPAPGPGPDAVPGPVFGNVQKPAWVERLIPDSQNTAWDSLGQRGLKGVVYHRQEGTNWGTDSWFRMLWQPNGKKGGGQMGLTDFGVDHQTGEILRWNDCFGQAHPGVSPNRSPWASGPWQNPPGDGRALVAKYGVEVINRDLVSIEISGWYNDAISAQGKNAVAHLSAWLADAARVPWTDYPYNPETGLVFTYWHSEFQSQKPCPGDVVRNETSAIAELTKAILKAAQTAGQPKPVVPVDPDPQPQPEPGPLPVPDRELLAWAFGKVEGDDGKTYVFNPEGDVSRWWLSQMAANGKYPRLVGVKSFGLTGGRARKVFLFADGTMIEWRDGSGIRLLDGP